MADTCPHHTPRAGKGKYTYSDGGYYEGEFVSTLSHYKHGVHFPKPDGLRHGRGVRVYANGNRYEGPFREGEPNGLLAAPHIASVGQSDDQRA